MILKKGKDEIDENELMIEDINLFQEAMRFDTKLTKVNSVGKLQNLAAPVKKKQILLN